VNYNYHDHVFTIPRLGFNISHAKMSVAGFVDNFEEFVSLMKDVRSHSSTHGVSHFILIEEDDSTDLIYTTKFFTAKVSKFSDIIIDNKAISTSCRQVGRKFKMTVMSKSLLIDNKGRSVNLTTSTNVDKIKLIKILMSGISLGESELIGAVFSSAIDVTGGMIIDVASDVALEKIAETSIERLSDNKNDLTELSDTLKFCYTCLSMSCKCGNISILNIKDGVIMDKLRTNIVECLCECNHLRLICNVCEKVKCPSCVHNHAHDTFSLRLVFINDLEKVVIYNLNKSQSSLVTASNL